ncbi:HAMP domain-containing methyl-accepting chemotaxis protein [Aliidiomarina quisquiliarum]|uniref:HAMP domain-containing methyl-accepting chemotaxis protein n=1 Tax=Aliidiomarina quisquiliarum TaxID=2938947 RepID=UPI00208EFE81|nr:methyl-accepting chemotaxis protein [Aliidiomarina quisquiliarum]MCO4321355.1 methyl-accepting chemotaxis protein [Aliidiomarina quisquiliarum]
MKNISVAKKLTGGIGFILFLSIILAVNNFYSLNQLTMRSNNLKALALINNDVNGLRITSALYKLTPNAQLVEDTHALADKIKRTARESRANLTAASSRQAMDKIVADITDYEQSFDNYIQAHHQIEANIAAAVRSGASTNTALSQLNALINGSIQQPTIYTDAYSAVTGRLVTELAMARRTLAYTARVFITDRTVQSVDTLEQAYAALQDTAAKLQPRLAGQAASLTTEITTGVAGYMTLLRDIVPLNDTLLTTETHMNTVYTSVSSITDQLVRFATALGDQEMSTAKTIAAGLTIAEIVLGVLIGWIIIKQITHPLSQAVAIAKAIGNRNMTGSKVDPRGDEFGALLNALEQTRTNLREALTEVAGFTTQLASAAEELSAVTAQTSAGVSMQRQETEQVATAMNEMTATVHEVARNAENAAAAGERANRLATNGEQVLQGALDANRRLTAQVQQSAEAMHRLNEDSANISTVLTVINGLAQQTNLLALNAAIEAARAGEVGRGFAVVADEVRNLAHSTQRSTSQIEELIENLQSGSKNAVEMMDNSYKLSDSTLELVQEANTELKVIAQTVLEIQSMGMQIATAAEEQSLVAEEINRNVVNVNNAADQSATAVEETASASQALARLGQELNNLVARFKI